MRFLQAFAVLIFLALIGILLKPLYWDRVEDFIRARSDFGVPSDGAEGAAEGYATPEGHVTRSGFERFRAEIREGYSRIQDVERLRREAQRNFAIKEALNEEIASRQLAFDSLAQALHTEYVTQSQVDSLMKGFVQADDFTALQGFVQGLHRARGGGAGAIPTPSGRPVFRRRDLWKGFHQTYPPYLAKSGGSR